MSGVETLRQARNAVTQSSLPDNTVPHLNTLPPSFSPRENCWETCTPVQSGYSLDNPVGLVRIGLSCPKNSVPAVQASAALIAALRGLPSPRSLPLAGSVGPRHGLFSATITDTTPLSAVIVRRLASFTPRNPDTFRRTDNVTLKTFIQSLPRDGWQLIRGQLIRRNGECPISCLFGAEATRFPYKIVVQPGYLNYLQLGLIVAASDGVTYATPTASRIRRVLLHHCSLEEK